MWIRNAIRVAVGVFVVVMAAIGFTAGIEPTSGVAHCGEPFYLASKELSQWASDL